MTSDPYHARKHEEVYRLTKAGIEEERSRSTRLDEKASRYLTFLAIVAGVGAFGGKTVVQTLRPLGTLDWIVIGISALWLLAVLAAGLWTFSVLKVQAWVRFPPMDTELLEYFAENRYLNILHSLARENILTADANKMVNDKKAARLSWAYWFALVAFLLAVLAIVAATVAVIRSPS